MGGPFSNPKHRQNTDNKPRCLIRHLLANTASKFVIQHSLYPHPHKHQRNSYVYCYLLQALGTLQMANIGYSKAAADMV